MKNFNKGYKTYIKENKIQRQEKKCNKVLHI